jgi:hypothetical protein
MDAFCGVTIDVATEDVIGPPHAGPLGVWQVQIVPQMVGDPGGFFAGRFVGLLRGENVKSVQILDASVRGTERAAQAGANALGGRIHVFRMGEQFAQQFPVGDLFAKAAGLDQRSDQMLVFLSVTRRETAANQERLLRMQWRQFHAGGQAHAFARFDCH